jgi:hypothetical protein
MERVLPGPPGQVRCNIFPDCGVCIHFLFLCFDVKAHDDQIHWTTFRYPSSPELHDGCLFYSNLIHLSLDFPEPFNSCTPHLLEACISKWTKTARRHSISRQGFWTSESAHFIPGHCMTIVHPAHPILYPLTSRTKKCAKFTDACLPTEVNLLKPILNSQREVLRLVERRLGQST